jgi:hypothetical protein
MKFGLRYEISRDFTYHIRLVVISSNLNTLRHVDCDVLVMSSQRHIPPGICITGYYKKNSIDDYYKLL